MHKPIEIEVAKLILQYGRRVKSEEYTTLEKSAIKASSKINNWRVKRFANRTSGSRTSYDASIDAIFRYTIRRFVENIFAISLLLLIFTLLSMSMVTFVNNEFSFSNPARLFNEVFRNVYIYHTNSIFADPATFTTLSIGVVAGSLSVASISRSKSRDQSQPTVAYADLIDRVANYYNSFFMFLSLSQIAIWFGGLRWKTQLCINEKQVDASGSSYWHIEPCGLASPIILLDSILVAAVCGIFFSISSQYSEQVAARRQATFYLKESIQIVLSRRVEKRRLPIWNVINLHLSISLLIFLLCDAAIEYQDADSTDIQWIVYIIINILMNVVSSLILYKMIPYVANDSRSPRTRRIIAQIVHLLTSLAFSLSLGSYMSEEIQETPLILLILACFLSMAAPLFIILFPGVRRRLSQNELNEDLRVLRQRTVRAERLLNLPIVN